MADIFISYSRRNTERAKLVASLLGERGFSAWTDRRIDPGDPWNKVLESQLKQAHAVVVLWTQESVQSPWVLKEAQLAGRRLVPAILDDVEPPSTFAAVEAANLRGLGEGQIDENELLNFVKAVRELVKKGRLARIGRWVGAVLAVVVLAIAVYWFVRPPPPDPVSLQNTGQKLATLLTPIQRHEGIRFTYGPDSSAATEQRIRDLVLCPLQAVTGADFGEAFERLAAQYEHCLAVTVSDDRSEIRLVLTEDEEWTFVKESACHRCEPKESADP